jgi:hypothetical protein
VFVNRPGARWNGDDDGAKVLTRARVTATAEPVDRSRDAGTDWSAYDRCGFCGAAAGHPCYDLGRPGSLNAHPHDGRPGTAGPYDTYDSPPTPTEIEQYRGLCGETVYGAPHPFVDDPEMAARRDYETCGEPADAEIHQPNDPADEYAEARRRDIAADLRFADQLDQAAAVGDFTSHNPGDACSLGLWHTGPCQPPAVAYTGQATLPNHWGADDGVVPVSYHPDGPVGNAVRSMGDDRRIDMGGGESLENRLGRNATRMARGSVPFGEGVDEYRRIRDALPAGSTARRHLDTILARVDAPPAPVPELPDSAPEPVRRLMDTLAGIPLARVPSSETGREADTEVLAALMGRYAGRRVHPRMLASQVAMKVANRHHEHLSDVGKAHVDVAVRQCVRELRNLK